MNIEDKDKDINPKESELKLADEDLKLSFTREVYTIDKMNGRVDCEVTGVINASTEYGISIVCMEVSEQGAKFEPKTFTAKASTVLHEGDEWDEIRGRRIALAKACRKIYDQARSFAAQKLKQLAPTMIALSEFGEDMGTYSKREDESIKNLIS